MRRRERADRRRTRSGAEGGESVSKTQLAVGAREHARALSRADVSALRIGGVDAPIIFEEESHVLPLPSWEEPQLCPISWASVCAVYCHPNKSSSMPHDVRRLHIVLTHASPVVPAE